MTVELERPFEAPWQASAFALVVNMHERGLFTWDEWAQTLGRAIAVDPSRDYFEAWLEALETIAIAQNAVTTDAIVEKQQAWLDAAARTPHGKPIELEPSGDGRHERRTAPRNEPDGR